MIKHFNIKISGLVQGVFFRDFASNEAKKLRLSGFVRNEPDGSVYIETEGEEDDLQKFILLCKSGPVNASVDNVEIIEAPVKNLKSFAIMSE